MNNNYKYKYLKYKNKYNNLNGGSDSLDAETYKALLSISLDNIVDQSYINLYLSIQRIKKQQEQQYKSQYKQPPIISSNKQIPQQQHQKTTQMPSKPLPKSDYVSEVKKKADDYLKYMGIPGWPKSKKLQLPARDINIDNKTIGKYIWDVDEQIMAHLKQYEKDSQYYKDILSLQFMPIAGLSENVKLEVQQLIKLSYPTKKTEAEYPVTYPYNRLNLLQKNIAKGYYYDYSKEIVDHNSQESLKLFEQVQKKKPKDLIKKLNALFLNFQRTCETAHLVQGNTVKTKPYEPLLFENLFIGKSNDIDMTEKDNKQLLYTSTPHISKYFNNGKVIVSPFLQPDLSMGLLSYNTKTNKAITQCIFTHSPLVFPLRMILFLSLLSITYINLYENIKSYDYIGFFLIRLSNNIENITIDEICKIHYDNNDTQFPDSQENYWVIFVFQKKRPTLNKHAQYEFINYRCNRVDRGTIVEQKKVIYTEIEQLICMYSNNQLDLYILLLFNKNMIKQSRTDSCKTFFEQFTDFNKSKEKIDNTKTPPNLCLISNLHHTFLKLLNDNFILPYTVYNYDSNITDPNYKYNEQHIFISKKQSIEELFDKIINFREMQKSILLEYIYYLLNNHTLLLEDIEYIILFEKSTKHYDLILKYYNIYIELLNIEITLRTMSELKYIEIKSRELTYGLFPCHFDWSSNNELYDNIEDELEIERHRLFKKINKDNKDKIKILLEKLYVKERLCIKYGQMSEKKKAIFKKTTCIEKKCIQFLNDSYRDQYMSSMFTDEFSQNENILDINEFLI